MPTTDRTDYAALSDRMAALLGLRIGHRRDRRRLGPRPAGGPRHPDAALARR